MRKRVEVEWGRETELVDCPAVDCACGVKVNSGSVRFEAGKVVMFGVIVCSKSTSGHIMREGRWICD